MNPRNELNQKEIPKNYLQGIDRQRVEYNRSNPLDDSTNHADIHGDVHGEETCSSRSICKLDQHGEKHVDQKNPGKSELGDSISRNSFSNRLTNESMGVIDRVEEAVIEQRIEEWGEEYLSQENGKYREEANQADNLRSLDCYHLGVLDFEEILRYQRRWVFDISGARNRGVLCFCEHNSTISIGRRGSVNQITRDVNELRRLGWKLQWVNRGGDCAVHVPGQLVVYSIVALDALQIGINGYLDCLSRCLQKVLAEQGFHIQIDREQGRYWLGDRCVGQIGIAITNWVAYFGFNLNIDPDLSWFRYLNCKDQNSFQANRTSESGYGSINSSAVVSAHELATRVNSPQTQAIMTSLERECRHRLRRQELRQNLMEEYAKTFNFELVTIHQQLRMRPAPLK